MPYSAKSRKAADTTSDRLAERKCRQKEREEEDIAAHRMLAEEKLKR